MLSIAGQKPALKCNRFGAADGEFEQKVTGVYLYNTIPL
jgi:hypothetical protein